MDDREAGPSGSAATIMDDFDVFLNHRGPDVKATFVAHLEDALRCAGFRPFLDARSLRKGNPALRSIDQALDTAKVHVAVVSKRYAESKYCLNELVAMMRSGKPVIPVFYDVEPLDLRWVENGPFALAFQQHSAKGRSQRKLQEWRDALRSLAELTGFRLAAFQSDEAQLKREVVNEVARRTPSNDPVEVEEYRVGLEGPTNACIQVLEKMSAAGIGMLGLVGMGGVGKTTLAREIYNHLVAQRKFRNMTFLEILRDNPSSANVQVRPTWSRKLRKQLLSDLFSVQDSTSSYSSWFRKVSALGPVFIVIDDVHKLGQFEELIPSASFLHPGSQILVTSRDRSILKCVSGRAKMDHHLYDVSTLDSAESNMLFNWHAFQAQAAPEDYKDLAQDVVKACDGLPLALKVTGSSLFDKRSDEDRDTIWPEAIDALKQSTDVMGVLKWSYDNLSDSEKLMFVDIACLFYDRGAKEALAFWASCKNCPSCGGVKIPHTSLRNLIDKNIVKQYQWGGLDVHDLLRDLGQEIGRKAKTHFICGGMEDGRGITNQGIEETMALNLAGSRKRKFDAESFANMQNLHFLILPNGCSVNGDLRCISRELRLLQWRNMPFACVPSEINLFHLLSLDFSQSTNLASLWTQSNVSLAGCPNLCWLNLSECSSITRLPDSIGQSSQLQQLNLTGCESLKRFPKSIGQLKALRYLMLNECKSLKALPDTIGGLSNLVTLHAHHCNSLVKLPDSIGLLSSLQVLEITANTECQVLSNGNIGEAWIQLRHLHLINCGGLGSIINYGTLRNLQGLDLSSSALIELPESIGLLTCLTSLRIFASERLQCLPKAIGDLKKLETLYLKDCGNLKKLPKTLGALTNLKQLSISCCPIKRLPKSVGQLAQLNLLEMEGCKNLEKLPISMRQLRSLKEFGLEECGSIEAMGVLTTLQGLPIWGSTSITKLPAFMGVVSDLTVVYEDNSDVALNTRRDLYNDARQILEEDESGFLGAYHNESTGLTGLLRWCDHKE